MGKFIFSRNIYGNDKGISDTYSYNRTQVFGNNHVFIRRFQLILINDSISFDIRAFPEEYQTTGCVNS